MQEINAKYNLKSLLENYRVVIPLIQRDYAQGRKDKRTTEVRKKLLQDIRDLYLQHSKKELFPILFRLSIIKSPYGGFFVPYNLSKHSQARMREVEMSLYRNM